MPCIDLAFRLNGSVVPVDHGYALYSALSRIVPEIHEAKAIGVHPIRGMYNGIGKLQLSDSSRLVLRLPDDEIRPYLKLAGKRLEVDEHPLSVGVPEVRMLLPVSVYVLTWLQSRLSKRRRISRGHTAPVAESRRYVRSALRPAAHLPS